MIPSMLLVVVPVEMLFKFANLSPEVFGVFPTVKNVAVEVARVVSPKNSLSPAKV